MTILKINSVVPSLDKMRVFRADTPESVYSGAAIYDGAVMAEYVDNAAPPHKLQYHGIEFYSAAGNIFLDPMPTSKILEFGPGGSTLYGTADLSFISTSIAATPGFPQGNDFFSKYETELFAGMGGNVSKSSAQAADLLKIIYRGEIYFVSKSFGLSFSSGYQSQALTALDRLKTITYETFGLRYKIEPFTQKMRDDGLDSLYISASYNPRPQGKLSSGWSPKSALALDGTSFKLYLASGALNSFTGSAELPLLMRLLVD